MPPAGLRPQWREEQALQEDTTTANMDTDRSEEQHDAGVGTFLAALRGGKVQQPAIRTVVTAKKFAGIQIPPATRRHIRVLQRPSHLLLTGLPAGTDDATHVALLFGDLVAQHQAMDEESRGWTVTNPIRTLSPKIGTQIIPTYVRVVTRRPPNPAAADTTGPSGTSLPTTTGSVILQLARRKKASSGLQTQWIGEGTAILDRKGRRCSTRLLGAPHLDDIERPVHQVWLRSPSFRGLTQADMQLHLAEGLLPTYGQPQPREAATNQPAATPADDMALAGVRAGAEFEADTYADDAVICPPTRTLLALLEVREVWKARRSADSVRLDLLDPGAARLLQDVCRDAVLALPYGDQSQGRAVIQITVEHGEDREN
eukprot:jgi/Tetstr1/456446/TSEL_043174.t1